MKLEQVERPEMPVFLEGGKRRCKEASKRIIFFEAYALFVINLYMSLARLARTPLPKLTFRLLSNISRRLCE